MVLSAAATAEGGPHLPDSFRGRMTPMRLARSWDRNFWLGVYNGIFVNGSEAFFHSTLVLAPFLAALGAPAVVVGLIPALRVGGWFLPQLFVAHQLAHVPRKMPLYRRTSVSRTISWTVMTVSVFLFADRPDIIILAVLAMLVVNSFSSGVSGVPFADVTAKVVPHFRLGTYWALRNAVGGALALVAGLVLRRILASDIPFPQNFGLVFVFGTILAALSYLSFSLVKEPPGATGQRAPFRKMLDQIPQILRRDPSLRRYLRVRFLALLGLLADPFYAIFAIDRLGAPQSVLGLYVVIATVASIAVNFVFRVPANRARNVTVLQISIGLLVAAPVLALIAPSWQVFAVVFACSAAGNSGVGVAAWNLLYALAPEDERPLYIGLANTVLTLPSLAPIIAGALLSLVGFRQMFLLAAVVAVLALSLAFRFRELRALDARALQNAG